MQAYAATDPSIGILQRTFSSCAPMGKDLPEMRSATDACLRFNEAVEREIQELHRHGLQGVVLSSMWLSMYAEADADIAASTEKSPIATAHAEQSPTARLERALRNLVGRLEKEGLKVLIIAPSPLMPHSVPQCMARHSAEQCAGSRVEFERLRRPALEIMHRIAAASHGAVKVWDPIDALCDSRNCFAQKNGAIMFTDALHLSASGARQLRSSAEPQLGWLVH
jgi:hypothetical protein